MVKFVTSFADEVTCQEAVKGLGGEACAPETQPLLPRERDGSCAFGVLRPGRTLAEEVEATAGKCALGALLVRSDHPGAGGSDWAQQVFRWVKGSHRLFIASLEHDPPEVDHQLGFLLHEAGFFPSLRLTVAVRELDAFEELMLGGRGPVSSVGYDGRLDGLEEIFPSAGDLRLIHVFTAGVHTQSAPVPPAAAASSKILSRDMGLNAQDLNAEPILSPISQCKGLPVRHNTNSRGGCGCGSAGSGGGEGVSKVQGEQLGSAGALGPKADPLERFAWRMACDVSHETEPFPPPPLPPPTVANRGEGEWEVTREEEE
ncbi:unnamed protein product, partial [Discosporangium mesarthrocarpum]